MSSATVRINEYTRKLLRELAAASGESMQTIVERALWDSTLRDGLEDEQ